jgi:hypothetical protein
MRDRLVIPIDLRAAKALPRNCGHRPLVGRRTPGERGGGLFAFFCCFTTTKAISKWLLNFVINKALVTCARLNI